MLRLLAGLSLAAILALISHGVMAQQQFDGQWSVEAIPEKGACKKAHRYVVAIENGIVRNSVSRKTRVNIMGGLEASGRVRGSIQRNKTRIDVTGSLLGPSGSGNWAIAGRVNCSGRWDAEKRS
jgi:hypothetical protein